MKRYSTSGLEEPGPSQTRKREKRQEVLELGGTDALGSFNVFLNHRGPDVKKSFVAHLERGTLCSWMSSIFGCKVTYQGTTCLQLHQQGPPWGARPCCHILSTLC